MESYTPSEYEMTQSVEGIAEFPSYDLYPPEALASIVTLDHEIMLSGCHGDKKIEEPFGFRFEVGIGTVYAAMRRADISYHPAQDACAVIEKDDMVILAVADGISSLESHDGTDRIANSSGPIAENLLAQLSAMDSDTSLQKYLETIDYNEFDFDNGDCTLQAMCIKPSIEGGYVVEVVTIGAESDLGFTAVETNDEITRFDGTDVSSTFLSSLADITLKSRVIIIPSGTISSLYISTDALKSYFKHSDGSSSSSAFIKKVNQATDDKISRTRALPELIGNLRDPQGRKNQDDHTVVVMHLN